MFKAIFWIAVGAALVYYFYNKKKTALDQAVIGDGAPSSGSGAADLTTIINKVGRTFMSGKYDDGLALINANIDRFHGVDKAQLLNQRGGLYTIKGDQQSALADYKAAYELDDNMTNLNNYVEILAKLGMYDVARPLAEQGLKNPNAGRDEKKLFESVMNA